MYSIQFIDRFGRNQGEADIKAISPKGAQRKASAAKRPIFAEGYKVFRDGRVIEITKFGRKACVNPLRCKP